MSKSAVTIPADVLAYKQLKLHGFWMASWNAAHSVAERVTMINDIADLIRTNKLSFFFELHDFDDFDYALKTHLEPHKFRKVVLNMDYPDRFKEHDAKSDSDYFVFDTSTV